VLPKGAKAHAECQRLLTISGIGLLTATALIAAVSDVGVFRNGCQSVGTTLKQQKRNVLDYLTAAHEAALRGEPAPSLLPESDQKSQAAA
jgi:transposase